MEQTWRKFIAFLHKENAYKEYRNGLYKYCLKNSISIQERIENLKNRSDMFFIASAFPWSMTNNGDRFWSDINRKWLSYRNELV